MPILIVQEKSRTGSRLSGQHASERLAVLEVADAAWPGLPLKKETLA